jgi:hypothetical protein
MYDRDKRGKLFNHLDKDIGALTEDEKAERGYLY